MACTTLTSNPLPPEEGEEVLTEESMKDFVRSFILIHLLLLAAACPLIAAETLDQLIAGAKKESEFTFIAGAQTFGGTKNLSVSRRPSIRDSA